MSFYRDVYLKSQDWKNLRAAVLARDRNKCRLCGYTSASNDVHHIQYRKLYDVKPTDLWTLCRACHDQAHVWLAEMPKNMAKWAKWRLVLEMFTKTPVAVGKARIAKLQRRTNHLQREGKRLLRKRLIKAQKTLVLLRKRLKIAQLKALERAGKPQIMRVSTGGGYCELSPKAKGVFFRSKRLLIKAGLVSDSSMPMHPACEQITEKLEPVAYMELYISATGLNPQRQG